MSGVAESLRGATPLVEHVELEPVEGRIIASVYLDPILVRGRAEQQGLADGSTPAAARSARVQLLLTSAVAGCRASLQIVMPGGDSVMADGALR